MPSSSRSPDPSARTATTRDRRSRRSVSISSTTVRISSPKNTAPDLEDAPEVSCRASFGDELLLRRRLALRQHGRRGLVERLIVHLGRCDDEDLRRSIGQVAEPVRMPADAGDAPRRLGRGIQPFDAAVAALLGNAGGEGERAAVRRPVEVLDAERAPRWPAPARHLRRPSRRSAACPSASPRMKAIRVPSGDSVGAESAVPRVIRRGVPSGRSTRHSWPTARFAARSGREVAKTANDASGAMSGRPTETSFSMSAERTLTPPRTSSCRRSGACCRAGSGPPPPGRPPRRTRRRCRACRRTRGATRSRRGWRARAASR